MAKSQYAILTPHGVVYINEANSQAQEATPLGGYLNEQNSGVARELGATFGPSSALVGAINGNRPIQEAIASTSLQAVALHKLGGLAGHQVPMSALSANLVHNRAIAADIAPQSVVTGNLARIKPLSGALTPTSLLTFYQGRNLLWSTTPTSLMVTALRRSRALVEGVAPVSLMNVIPNVSIGMIEAVTPISDLECSIARSRALREGIRPTAVPFCTLGRSIPLVPDPIISLSAVALTRMGGGHTRPFLVVVD